MPGKQQALPRVLIESDWNLKCFQHNKDFQTVHSINRIRLEFKAACQALSVLSRRVLIESDWNLKPHLCTIRFIKFFKVLIESDWNLKY